jgi:hypothetical protein
MPSNFRRNPVKIKVPKVLLIDFRPPAVPQGWRNAIGLAEEFIEAMIQISHKILIYELVAKLEIATYPFLTNGLQYNDVTWPQAMQDEKSAIRDSHGNPLLADYQRILLDYKILQGIKNNQIDEVWMFGGPYFGFYESQMVGKGAFWCNSPGIEQATRRFVVMGFNYQRGLREMIHSYGHRVESILARNFNSQDFQNKLYTHQPTPAPKNPFEQWLLKNGTVHSAPNGAEYGQNEIDWATALNTEWWPLISDPNAVK